MQNASLKKMRGVTQKERNIIHKRIKSKEPLRTKTQRDTNTGIIRINITTPHEKCTLINKKPKAIFYSNFTLVTSKKLSH